MTRWSGKRGPTPLGTLLEGSGRLQAKSDRMDRGRWRTLVGDRIGERTRPGSVRDGCLTIYVASAVWAQELSLLSTTIIERLVRDGFAVKELRFRVGDIGEPPVKRPVVEQASVPKAELPKGLTERLAHIEDPALRAAIAEAASYSLGRTERPSAERRTPRAPRAAARENAPRAPSPVPRSGAPKGNAGKRSR